MKSCIRISLSKTKAAVKKSIADKLLEYKINIGEWHYASRDTKMPDVTAIIGHLSSEFPDVTFCVDLHYPENTRRMFFKNSESVSEDILGVVFPSSVSFSSALKSKEKRLQKAMVHKKEAQIKLFEKRAKELKKQILELRKNP